MKKLRLRERARPASLILALAVLSTLSVLTGCTRAQAPPEADAGSAHTYSLRGVLRQIPPPGQAGVPLLIQHEAIDDYVNVSGNVAPMASMTMPFSIAEGIDLGDLAVSDKVAFELRVDWQADAAMLITSIEKLPAETVLDFGDD